MRKQLLLLKTLLVAVLLGVGTSAWATRTITYDFASAVASGGIAESSLTSSGTSAGTINGTTVYYPSELTAVLQNRFAFQYREKSGNTNAWSVDKSRGGLWSNCASGIDDYFSIMNLKAGDVVTVTFTGEIYFSTTTANATYDNEGVATTPAQWATMTSGTAYTIKADGKLDLQAKKFQSGTRGHLVISSVVIETSDEELIETAPTVAVTGANFGAREVTITSYKTSNDKGTTAYYTLDGTTPTSSSTKYTSAFSVSSSDDDDSDGIVVVKAIAYKTDDTSIASTVTTLNVEVGTTIALNAPTISVSGLVKNGSIYNATYSFASNQSGLIGSPTATLSYTFAGSSSTEGTSYTPTSAGQLIVTASAAGYASKSTTVNITLPNYIRTYFADFSTLEKGDKQGYSSYQINNAGCDFYTYTNTFDELTLSGFSLAWAITDSYVAGLYARGSAGTITYKEGLPDGFIIDFSCANNTSAYHVYSTTATTTIPQYVGVYDMSIYSPTVSTTVSNASFATYVNSDYDLDFSKTSIEAYKVKVSSKGLATLTKVNEVPAGTPVLLYANDGATENIPVITSADAVTDNDLVAGTGAAVATTSGDYTNMILNVVDEQIGFYFANDKTVATDRAYLHIASTLAPAAQQSRMKMVFAGETTGVKSLPTSQKGEESVYNLAGQRVKKPTKGLYVKGGKKVIVK